jgi:hypothetical protein
VGLRADLDTEAREKSFASAKDRTTYKIKIPVYFTCCLCGCETWSLTARKEHRLKVFENRVLRGIFGRWKDGRG